MSRNQIFTLKEIDEYFGLSYFDDKLYSKGRYIQDLTSYFFIPVVCSTNEFTPLLVAEYYHSNIPAEEVYLKWYR